MITLAMFTGTLVAAFHATKDAFTSIEAGALDAKIKTLVALFITGIGGAVTAVSALLECNIYL